MESARIQHRRLLPTRFPALSPGHARNRRRLEAKFGPYSPKTPSPAPPGEIAQTFISPYARNAFLHSHRSLFGTVDELMFEHPATGYPTSPLLWREGGAWTAWLKK